MEQSTDLKLADTGDGVVPVLRAVAEHFTEIRPTEVLERQSLAIAFGAGAYKVADRSMSGGSDKLAGAALVLAPEAPDGITRGEYALLVRRVLAESGHEWSDGDNDRAIPAIPRPRTEPTPKAPKGGRA
ncbi:hypothetical protein [Streptomyces niveus]|uniref:hypothetical protein n=1 Tax=Streptomyces niveus TaxID=193462 RepID=UPI0036D31477